ncbi:MAG: DUF2683 family protein [Candidatus Kuenenbacteria bacterium]
MNIEKIKVKIKNPKLILQPEEAGKLFKLSIYLADFFETQFESQGLYKKEFIKGLKESEEDLKKGRFRKIKSLSEL